MLSAHSLSVKVSFAEIELSRFVRSVKVRPTELLLNPKAGCRFCHVCTEMNVWKRKRSRTRFKEYFVMPNCRTEQLLKEETCRKEKVIGKYWKARKITLVKIEEV